MRIEIKKTMKQNVDIATGVKIERSLNMASFSLFPKNTAKTKSELILCSNEESFEITFTQE